jgi:hypothetical protein
MEEQDRADERTDADNYATNSQPSPVGVNSEQQYKRETKITRSRTEHPSETTDQLLQEFWDWLRREKVPAHGWITAISSVALLAVTFGQLVIACNNYVETSPLVGYAQKTSEAADRFATAAQGINGGVGNAVGKLGDQVGKLDRQAGATERAAGAAGSAATTAEEAFHVSERAYVRIEDPRFNFSEKSMTLPLVNTGHMASGTLTSIAHKATFILSSPSDIVTMDHASEISWQHSNFASISPGNHESLEIPLPLLEEDKINKGLEMVIIAGSLSFNDGFPDTPLQNWKFCFQSYYHSVMKKNFIGFCNVEEILPEMEKADGYPNNEHPK